VEKLKQTVLEILEEKGCRPLVSGNLIRVKARSKREEYALCLLAGEQALLSVACWPEAIPDEKQMELAHFLHLANLGLLLGCFELDFDAGELLYRCCVLAEDALPPRRALERCIFTPLSMMEACAPGIRAVLRGECLADAAYARCD